MTSNGRRRHMPLKRGSLFIGKLLCWNVGGRGLAIHQLCPVSQYISEPDESEPVFRLILALAAGYFGTTRIFRNRLEGHLTQERKQLETPNLL